MTSVVAVPPRPGDIVLIANAGFGAAFNMFLQDPRGGQYSHAMLVVGRDLAVHAVPKKGVYPTSTLGVLRDSSIKYYCALRLKEPSEYSEKEVIDRRDAIWSEARKHFNRKYNWLFRFSWILGSKASSVAFCSELVSEILGTTGVVVSERKHRSTFPRQLAALKQDPKWSDITEGYKIWVRDAPRQASWGSKIVTMDHR